MRVAILTTDMREAVPGCADPQPRIGLAPSALLQGFALLPEAEIHVVSCLKEPLPSPGKIAPNIFYHGVAVPRIGWLRTGYQGCIRAARKKLKAKSSRTSSTARARSAIAPSAPFFPAIRTSSPSTATCGSLRD